MDIYITRHGQTDFNVTGYWQGCLLNPSLNEYGKEQANKLADKFRKVISPSLDFRMYCSPLRRAYETGEIICKKLEYNYLPMIKTSLIEGNFGIAEGHTEQELKIMMPKEFSQWKDLDNLKFKFKNGESKEEIGERLNKQLYDSISYMYGFSSTKNIIMITHSAAIRCLLLKYGIKQEEIPFGTIYHFKVIKLNNNWFNTQHEIKYIESF